MHIARLDTPEGRRHAVWTGAAWEVVADCFADPLISTGVSIAPQDAYLLAPCQPRLDRNTVDEKNFEVEGGHGCTPIGPWNETELNNPEQVVITVTVNGIVKAASGTFNLPSTVAESIAYVARWVQLGPGDVIMSGSPNTFTAVTSGDEVEVRLPGSARSPTVSSNRQLWAR